MSDPQTGNILLAIPTRGSDTGTWDLPVNGDFNSIDGHFGGVVTVGLTNVNVTLTAPTGTATPSPGPTQAENAVVRLTGTLSGNVQITLPLPGPIIVENLTTGAFVVSFRAVGSGEIIATAQGTRKAIYNDGTNVRFVGGPDPGAQELWASLSAIPAWVSACTVKPWLLCDGSIYNFSDYPYLGAMFGATFGGNGSTTFGVPDLRGRVPLAYDGTGTRITTAGCGINGQTLGAAGGLQTSSILRTDLPNTSVTVTITDPGHPHTIQGQQVNVANGSVPLVGFVSGGSPIANSGIVNSNTTGITAAFNLNGAATQTFPANVQPSQVNGIWVVHT